MLTQNHRIYINAVVGVQTAICSKRQMGMGEHAVCGRTRKGTKALLDLNKMM